MPLVVNYNFMTSSSENESSREGGGREGHKMADEKWPPAPSGVTVCGAKAEGVYLVFILHFIIIPPPLIHWLLYAPLTTAYR